MLCKAYPTPPVGAAVALPPLLGNRDGSADSHSNIITGRLQTSRTTCMVADYIPRRFCGSKESPSQRPSAADTGFDRTAWVRNLNTKVPAEAHLCGRACYCEKSAVRYAHRPAVAAISALAAGPIVAESDGLAGGIAFTEILDPQTSSAQSPGHPGGSSRPHSRRLPSRT